MRAEAQNRTPLYVNTYWGWEASGATGCHMQKGVALVRRIILLLTVEERINLARSETKEKHHG